MRTAGCEVDDAPCINQAAREATAAERASVIAGGGHKMVYVSDSASAEEDKGEQPAKGPGRVQDGRPRRHM